MRHLHVVDLPPHARHPLARAARNAGRLARRVPPLMDRFAGFGGQIAAATRGQRYEIAVIEHFWCAPYWEQAAAVSDATMLDLHNIESVLHARCAHAGNGAQALAHRAFQNICRDLEEEWLPRFTYLLAASEAGCGPIAHHFARLERIGLPEFDTARAASLRGARRM